MRYDCMTYDWERAWASARPWTWAQIRALGERPEQVERFIATYGHRGRMALVMVAKGGTSGCMPEVCFGCMLYPGSSAEFSPAPTRKTFATWWMKSCAKQAAKVYRRMVRALGRLPEEER